jgi:hypothetical protein
MDRKSTIFLSLLEVILGVVHQHRVTVAHKLHFYKIQMRTVMNN